MASSVGSDGLVDVPNEMVLVSMTPLLLVCAASWALDLGLVSDIVVSSVRTFVQLAILGYVLKPIFVQGQKHWWVVLLYVLLMVILASRECSSRPKYGFRGQFWAVFIAILLNVAAVSAFAFGVVIRPANPLDPQYVIPICGMLFGNVITGISLSLNALMTAFVEQRSEVELLLSFGATRYEASARLLRECVKVGTMPTINSMAVIGLISIPGMMTGQVLGGSSPDVAARYQMLIMYLIAVCGFGSILTIFLIVMGVAFNDSHQLRQDVFVKRAVAKAKSPKEHLVSIVANTCCLLCNYWCAIMDGYKPVAATVDAEVGEGGLKPPACNSITVQILNAQPALDTGSGGDPYLEAVRLARSVPVGSDPASAMRRNLFTNYSFRLGKGEVAVVTGPSGCGKSQLLRSLAGLVPLDSGEIRLNGKPRSAFPSMCAWRQKVRYVTQYKVETPGTPRDYVRLITSLAVNRTALDAPTFQEMVDDTNRLLSTWGMMRGSIDKEWKELSGGEAQRVIVALAMASRPKVLLLDESTSALDMSTKLQVEHSVEQLVREQATAVLWISHDDEQIARIESQLRSYAEVVAESPKSAKHGHVK